MLIKIQCGCGTRFSFDVEPVNGRMPVEVAFFTSPLTEFSGLTPAGESHDIS